MKILFSDNSLWSLLHFRGVIIKYFVNQGCEVILVAPYEDISLNKQIRGTTIIYVNIDRVNTGITADLRYIKDLWKIYKQQNPDFIFQYTIKPSLYGSIIAKLLSVSTICMLAGTGELFNGKGIKRKIALLLMRLSLLCTDKLFLLNADDQKRLLKGKYIMPNKIVMLEGGEGVDIEYYKPDLGYIVHPSRKFIMVGRVLYDKGYKEYVEVAKRIRTQFPDIVFYVLGYLDKRHPLAVPEIQVMNDVNAGYIHYLGTVEDIRPLVGECDCFILPSFYNEGMNRSLMEAISMGKPVISTNNKGCREMIIDGVNGYLIRPRDIDDLYKAVYNMCRMADGKLVEMGIESRKLAMMRFSDKKVLEEYMKIANE